MKKIVLITLLPAIWFSVIAQAETRYISGVIEITLRTGPGTDHRVLEMVKTGQEVTILSTDNQDWTLVEMPSGKQGWVMSRFITTEKPHTVALPDTSEQNEKLSRQVTELLEENKNLKLDYKRVQGEIADTRKALTSLNRSYETLKQETDEMVGIKAKYNESAANLTKQNKRNNEMKIELDKLRSYQNIKLFLSGAGVLLIGILLGLSVKKQRRKSKLI